MFAMEERSYSGPLPPPDYFLAYEQALKGSTARIMAITVVGLAVVFVLNKIPPIYPKSKTGQE